jgi:tetratricopeptide (TPR) repeat protein
MFNGWTVGDKRFMMLCVRSPLSTLLAVVSALVLCCGCTLELKTATEYLISGNEAFKAGDYRKAEKEYREALRLEPKSATALNNLGVVLNQLDEYAEATAVLRRATVVDPKNAIAHYTLAKVLTKTKAYDEALSEAQRAVDLAPDEMAAHRTLAETALAKAKSPGGTDDDWQLAIEEYRCILSSDPDDDFAQQNLGEALAKTGDKAGAVAALKKSVELNKDNAEARRLLAGLENPKAGHFAGATGQKDVAAPVKR